MLQIKNISKDYPVADDLTVHALKNVSVNFRKSEFVSILGPSGCGKTTLLNIIGGLDRYTSGDLVINGTSTKDYRDGDWDTYRNHSIGFVFQSYNLIPHMSILDNVTLSLTLAGAPKAERIAKAKAALTRVGLANQMRKRPNQLSGGQMQRVAIARAIVNEPDIILADEPTGALDSETSVQVMDILQEVSRDCLVVMVTHNRELAARYSTRIVSLLDGEIVSDTDPYNPTADEIAQQSETTVDKQTATQDIAQSDTKATSSGKTVTSKGKKRSKMSVWTSFVLSFKNLFSKKGRTLLTSFAGSIGIFGVALVLAISAGMTAYVNDVQSQATGDQPITIEKTAIDIDELMNGNFEYNKEGAYPTGTTAVTPYEPGKNYTVTNNLSEQYVAYLQRMDSTLYKAMDFTYSTTLHVYEKGVDGKYSRLGKFSSASSVMVSSAEMFAENYEVLYGAEGTSGYPTTETEAALVVDKYNRLSVTMLTNLGIEVQKDSDEYKPLAYTDLVGRSYKILLNDGLYVETAGKYSVVTDDELDAACESTNAVELKIVGILRRKSDTSSNLVGSGLAYTYALSQKLHDNAMQSAIVKAQKADPTINVLTGLPFESGVNKPTYDSVLTSLGGSEKPKQIDIYPQNASAKDKITEYLDKWNDSHPDEDDKVVYTDIQGVALSLMSTMIDVTTWVLVAFSAVSLLVSTVMIAVTTYTSVIERTKEIGILRSLGARKKDISGIFNAETSIIGALAGVIGVIFAVIVGVVVNVILDNMFDVTNIVLFNPQIIVGMIALSVVLTLVAGLIPAVLAARKDPVTCLRSE